MKKNKKKKSQYKEMTGGEMQGVQGSGNLDKAVISEHNFSVMIFEKGAGCCAKKS